MHTTYRNFLESVIMMTWAHTPFHRHRTGYPPFLVSQMRAWMARLIDWFEKTYCHRLLGSIATSL